MKTTAGARLSRARNDLALGLTLHRAGRLTDAATSYRRVLSAEPNNPDAHHLLGLLSLNRADLGDAVIHFARLVEIRPGVAEYRSNYGHALRLAGDLDGAERELEQAIRLDPMLADGWINLGLTRLDRDDVTGAIDALEGAVARAPHSALAHLNLGSALQRAGRLTEAQSRFRQAIELAPDLAPAYRNLGIVAQLAGADIEAMTAYRRALELVPGDPDILTNLGVVLTRRGDLDAAIEVHDRAAALAPHLSDVWLNRGTALQAAGRLEEARISLERAAGLDAGPKSLTALGSLAAELGDFRSSVGYHQAALGRDPGFADGHWNLALALLGEGQLAHGWDEYEWRWRASTGPARPELDSIPEWQGEPVAGRSVLVWREQGLGDELLFLSCLGDLIEAGALVTVVVSPRLVSLIQRAFPAARVRGEAPAVVAANEKFGWHLPMGSLPRWFRRTRAGFGPTGAYLRPAAAEATTWAERLAAVGVGRKVGVCWRSGLATTERRRHYAPWSAWTAMWRVPGVQWINLQYDDCDAELAEVEAVAGVRVHRWTGVDLRNDLESVAGLVARLDAVVTAPTMIDSMAGALGVTTWQVDSGSDWSSFGEDHSPWFPSIRVRRKGAGPSEAAWTALLNQLAEELTAWAADPEGSR